MKTINRKSLLIPHAWKSDLDGILSRELLGANRYFAQSNPKLKEQVALQSGRSPEQFLSELTERWTWHNTFFEDLLEPALTQLLPKNSFDLSPQDALALAAVYRSISLVDHATLVPTAAIKLHIEKWAKLLKDKMNLSDDEFIMLVTPTRSAFWIAYLADHLEYFAEIDPAKAELLKTKLLDQYHLTDDTIFSGRMLSLKGFMGMPQEKQLQMLEKLRKPHTLDSFYFSIERPYAKALLEVIAYDNDDEYRMLSAGIGISGFIFRKFILNILNDTKLISNEGAIYEIEDEEVIRGLFTLAEYRKAVMVRSIRMFRQSSNVTCAAACLCMVLDYYKISEAQTRLEMLIYESCKASLTDGSHLSAIQAYADKLNIETLLVHSESTMFRNDGFFESSVFSALMKEYKGFIDQLSEQGRVANGVSLTPQYMRSLLQEGHLLVVSGITWGVLHAVVVAGYNQKAEFLVYDPVKSTESWWSSSRLQAYSETPIGSWLLALKGPQREAKELFAQLPEFERKARMHLQ